jgi:hypothetical protein
MVSSHYEIHSLESVIKSMNSELTDEQLTSGDILDQMTIPEVREFWMDFIVLHLSAVLTYEAEDAESKSTVTAPAFIDVYATTLNTHLHGREFTPLVQKKLSKYGVHFILPTLAGFISSDFKAEILDELAHEAK